MATPLRFAPHPHPPDTKTLEAIQRRVLWLAVRMVDYANRERPSDDSLKVGGHHASSASVVSLMTALYFHDLRAADRVSVKPHAAPVLHAIEYLLGRLDQSYLTRLREFGGLQPYPSRTKDPFCVDYSTGSVGLGSVAPLFGALTDRYVESHFGKGAGGRQISLLGDAEFDEGSVAEAVAEPLTRGLGNVLWIVDLNRQSLDRVIPVLRAKELEQQFSALGWHVIELKYGRRLRAAFSSEGGKLLRERIDGMPNEEYQSLFGSSDEIVREVLLNVFDRHDRLELRRLLDQYSDVANLVRDLGGHDIEDIVAALAEARAESERPTIVFAYTIKGFGLEIAGRPMNHSALLSGDQIDRLRESVGLTTATEWGVFTEGSDEAAACAHAAERLHRPPKEACAVVPIPQQVTRQDVREVSTQAAFGRLMLELSRLEGIAERLVTVAPDVAVSTNLGGWINKVGVWAPQDAPMLDPMEDSTLRWRVVRSGQHIELGIAEMNLALLLGQLGLSADEQGERLFPIGTLYDPFVMRALEGLIYSTYSGSRFVIVGTPSGISLSREGGAHQSINTPGIGIETPGLTYAEPCFARELEWLFLHGLQQLQAPDGEALYLRLSTVPIDQRPFVAAVEHYGEEAVRTAVISGGFRVREAGDEADRVVIAAVGPTVPQALLAAEKLADEEGVEATVLCLSSPDRLYRDWRRRSVESALRGRAGAGRSWLEELVPPADRGAPVVTVIDGASHALAWVGSALGVRSVPLGVDRFGQGGSQRALYDEYGLSPDAIVVAALLALEP